MTGLSVVAALAAAVFIALSTALQHASATAAPATMIGSRRLLTHLVGRPGWLLGLAAGLIGFVLHALAVGVGAVSLVQPLMVSVLVFALPVRAALDRRVPPVRSLGWAAVTAAGLAGFVLAAHPSLGGGRPEQADAALLVTGGAVLAAAASWWASRASRCGRGSRAGLLLGAAGGVLFGVAAGVLKIAALAAVHGVRALLASWAVWAFVALSGWAFALNQRAYQAAPLSVSLPVLTMVEPIVSIVFGFAVFGERPAGQPLAVLVETITLLGVALGVTRLSSQTTQPAERTALPEAVRDRPRVVIVSGSVGAGHDGVARELASRLQADGLQVQVLDHLDFLPWPARRLLADGYTLSVGHAPFVFEWLFQRLEDSPLVLGAADLLCRVAGARLVRVLAGADTVVSTYPLASRSVGQLVASGQLTCPTVTYLTDPAPHRTWVHPSIGEHLTVTPATAAAGQQRYGVPMRAAGPLVPAAFEEPEAAGERQRLRGELGLVPAELAVLLVSGSLGLGEVGATADAIRGAGGTPVVLCGRNVALRRRVAGAGHLALAWRSDIAALMAACDVLVHNAGGLSLTEALAAGLPAVTFAPIPGHGQANARLLDTSGLVPWARTTDDLAGCLRSAAGRPRERLPAVEQSAGQIVAQLARAAHQPSSRTRIAGPFPEALLSAA